MRSLKSIIAILLSLVAVLGLLPLSVLAINLLINNGLNDPFDSIPGRTWNGQDEKIANGWQPFFLAAGTYDAANNAKKLHWLSSKQFADAFHGLDYHIEGNRAQNMWSSYQFDAGVYQQITGLTPGQDYGFDIAIATYWRGPGYPDSDGIMVKQVGIDPSGGTDPTSSNIIWSDTNSNDKAWVYLDVAATAQASTITVFAKVKAPENTSSGHTDLDMVYFEAAHMAPTPATTLNSSVNGATINVNWLGGSPAPAWSLKGYEVQYRDQANANWTTLQAKNSTNISGSFGGTFGHTYIVRARTWQKINESYNNDIDMPGIWQEKTIVLGALLNGQVTTNRGDGVPGITVSADPSGASTTTGNSGASTTTGNNGAYSLGLGSAGNYTVTAGTISNWTAPPPAAVSVQLNTTTYLSFTLRPPDDVIDNGDFENGLTGWQVNGTPPSGVGTGQHSGAASLRLSDTVTMSQTDSISGSYQPVLSFWYKTEGGDGDDIFTAEFLGANDLTPASSFSTSGNGDWQQVWLPLNLTEVYTGPVGVRFSLAQTGPTQTTVYLDEVSLGQSWGGPNRANLPLIFK